jgi:hypothetical protein
MNKQDLKKQLKGHYQASAKTPTILDVQAGQFITLIGRGAPDTPEYITALNALYVVAYTLKFTYKAKGMDFTVMPLEGLWWWDSAASLNLVNVPPRAEWNWKSMMRLPDFITIDTVEAIKEDVQTKKTIPAIDTMNLETFHEGLSAQIMHIGSYSTEEPTIKKLHDFIERHNYATRGLHHEIYLSNPQKVPLDRLKTIIRQPIEKLA